MTATPSARHDGPFPVLAVAALLALGIGGFIAFLVLAAFAPETRGDARGGANALSDSAVGFAGVVDLLRAVGTPVTVNRLAPIRAGSALLVLTPPAGKPADPAQQISDGSAVLIVLPKWTVTARFDHPGWVERAGRINAAQAALVAPAPIALTHRRGRHEAVLHGGGVPFSDTSELALGPIGELQVLDTRYGARNWTPLLLDEDGATVLARLTRPAQAPTFLLSDPDLIDTQGLKTLAGARAAIAILDGLRGEGPVMFDVTLNGLGHAPNLLRLLFEPPGLGATVCAMAAAGLILLMALRRFGPAIPPPRVLDFGKRALADTTAGLIESAGREPRMAKPYATLVRAGAVRDLGLSARLGEAATDRLLDSAARSRGLGPYADLARQAADATTRAAALAAARRLFQWGKGLRRGAR